MRREDEIRWRYLAWLTFERETLAGELGARSRLGIYIAEDRIVSQFFLSHEADAAERSRSGDRAKIVLDAAGVSTAANPHWLL